MEVNEGDQFQWTDDADSESAFAAIVFDKPKNNDSEKKGRDNQEEILAFKRRKTLPRRQCYFVFSFKYFHEWCICICILSVLSSVQQWRHPNNVCCLPNDGQG